MKTSNILLSGAIIILAVCLIAYDLDLKAEYLTIKKDGIKYYKENRFNEYDRINLKNFQNIELLAANSLNVNVEYGEKEAVWVKKWAKDKISFTQHGNTLTVDLSDKGKKENFEGWHSSIVIISPKLSKITTKAFTFIEKNGGYTISKDPDLKTEINGFTLDSLELSTSSSTHIELKGNTIKSLKATVGENSEDGTLFDNGGLVVSSNNIVKSVKLIALRESRVELLDTNIQTIDHKISDGAIVTFRGTAIPKLK